MDIELVTRRPNLNQFPNKDSFIKHCLKNRIAIRPEEYHDNALCYKCKKENNPQNLILISTMQYLCEACNIQNMYCDEPYFGNLDEIF